MSSDLIGMGKLGRRAVSMLYESMIITSFARREKCRDKEALVRVQCRFTRLTLDMWGL